MISNLIGAAMFWVYPALGLFALMVLGPGAVRKLARRRRP